MWATMGVGDVAAVAAGRGGVGVLVLFTGVNDAMARGGGTVSSGVEADEGIVVNAAAGALTGG